MFKSSSIWNSSRTFQINVVNVDIHCVDDWCTGKSPQSKCSDCHTNVENLFASGFVCCNGMIIIIIQLNRIENWQWWMVKLILPSHRNRHNSRCQTKIGWFEKNFDQNCSNIFCRQTGQSKYYLFANYSIYAFVFWGFHFMSNKKCLECIRAARSAQHTDCKYKLSNIICANSEF